MNKPTSINPYTADFEFFHQLYGGQGEIWEVLEGPNIKDPFNRIQKLIEELEIGRPEEKKKLTELSNLVCDLKYHAVTECFDAGLKETRKLMRSFSCLEGGAK